MEKITLSIYVPCFNEENNIVNTLNKIKEAIQNISYEVLVVDDASKDKTIDMVEKFKKDNPDINIKIFHNKNNQGIGFNHRVTAYKAIGKYYMMIVGDVPLPSAEIKKVVNNIGKADMVLPYLVDKRGFFRRILSRAFVFLINLITMNNIKYYNGPVICLLKNVKLYSGRRSGYGYAAELITAQLKERKTYIEVEISPYTPPSEKLELLELPAKLKNLQKLPSVTASLISIFFNQIIYIVKKILKIK